MIEESSEGVAEDARGGWGSDDCGVRGGDVRRDKGASELDDANGGETDRLIGEIMEGLRADSEETERDDDERRRETRETTKRSTDSEQQRQHKAQRRQGPRKTFHVHLRSSAVAGVGCPLDPPYTSALV